MLPVNVELSVRIERSRCALKVGGEAVGVCVEITFSGDVEGTRFDVELYGTRQHFCRETIARHPALSAVLRLIADEVELDKSPSEALLRSLLHSLLVYVSRVERAVPRPHWGRPLRDSRIERALELLNADLSRIWTVERLARAVGLSRPVFAREFVRILGLSPMRYLTQRRMERAARWLVETDASLAEIASHVGYQSEFALGRAFRRHYQVSPGSFRRQQTVVASRCLALAA